MRLRLFGGAFAAVVFAVSHSTPAAELKVQSDKENVVGSRVEGTWQTHAALTNRLTGKADGKSRFGRISFTADPSIVANIPDKYDKFLKPKQIYLAGTLTFKNKKHPFILIENRGNPHVVYFRERGGDPFGDAESFNVMLAVAKDKKNDLLFIGGDSNNQPFSAFERVEPKPKQ